MDFDSLLDDLASLDQAELARCTQAAGEAAAAITSPEEAMRAALIAATPPPAKAAAKPAAKPARRGPGRPPNKAPPPPLEKHGVSNLPDNRDNRLELVWDEPDKFKKLFGFLKTVRANEIHVRCRPDGITLFARDSQKQIRIVATIAGEHVNWYYCGGEIWLGLVRAEVEKLFNSIDASFYKISVIQRADDDEHLTVILKDGDLEKECNYSVMLSRFREDHELFEAELALAPSELAEGYPVIFSMTAKQFKKTVDDASHHSEVVSYIKSGNGPLQLTYAKTMLSCREIYHSSEKISLVSTVPPGAFFRSSLRLASIHPLATSMVMEDVRIYCQQQGSMVFRSAFESKALIVSTIVPTESATQK